MTDDISTQISQLRAAIAAQESLRPTLGDAIVDVATGALREKLNTLEMQTRPEQRKQVTILFADVIGFTAMSEKMDAEDVRANMNALWEKLDAIIVTYGGQIDKHIGDAVMAIWGIDIVREDDPEQAVHAALAMQVALQKENTRLQMRIGINTGSAILGAVGSKNEFTAMGDTVNLAARLEQAAPVGGILISQNTYRHVRGVFDFQPQPPLAVKGKDEFLQTYVILRPKSRTFRPGTRGVEGIETHMVGRTAELQQMKDGFLNMLESRQGRWFMVVGDAGVGKSRLLHEFEAWLQFRAETVEIFRGRATESIQHIPYALLRNIFAYRFEIADSDPLVTARAKLERGFSMMMPDDPDIIMKAHFVGHLIGLDFTDSHYLRGIIDDPAQIRNRAYHYLGQFFLQTGKHVILLLDDVHWADESTMDAFEHLYRISRSLPVFIITLARPAFFERYAGWTLGHRIDVHPLSQAESQQLVDQILHKVADLPESLRQMVIDGAEGNPFYLEELVKMLIDRKVILLSAAEWRVDSAQLAVLQVPPTLTGVLQARLDGLPHHERAAIQRAAVVGRIFWDDAVYQLGEEPPAEFVHAIQGLRARELIYEHGASTFEQSEEYIFKHAILRDVAYETVLKRLRRNYHLRVANWLVEKSGARANEFAGLIAEHFERAESPSDAALWYGKAGDGASDAFASATAITYYQKALTLSAQSDGDRDFASEISWQKGLAIALRAQARYEESLQACHAMRTAAEALGNPIAQMQAWSEEAFTHQTQGNNQLALECGKQSEVIARQSVSTNPAIQIELANAIYWQGVVLWRQGDADGAARLGQQVLHLCEAMGNFLTTRRVRARSLNLLGLVGNIQGRFEAAVQYFEQALALFRELDDRRSVGVMLNNLGANAYYRGEYEQSAMLYHEAMLIAHDSGNRGDEMLSLSNLGGVLVELSKYEEAEASLRQVIEQAGPTGAFFLSESYRYLSEACLGQGKVSEAAIAAERALVLGQEADSGEFIGAAWRALGNVSVADVHALQCLPEDYFSQSLQTFTKIGADAERARTLRDWARFEFTRGHIQPFQAMWQESVSIFSKLGMKSEVDRMDKENLDRHL